MSKKAEKINRDSSEKKRQIFVICIIVVALLVALIPVIIVAFKDKDEPYVPAPDIPEETFEGSYVLDYPNGMSVYEFKENNVVINTLAYTSDSDTQGNPGQKVTEVKSYTYEIVEEKGVNYIVLTNSETGETEKHTFNFGKNDWYRYFCETENCHLNNGGEGTQDLDEEDVDGNGKCSTHPDSSVTQKTVTKMFVEIAGEQYEK